MLDAPTVTVFMGMPFDPGPVFTLDDPTKGLLDGATYVLGGDLGETITDVYDVHVVRGRTSELDSTDVGTCQLLFRNHTRDYDGLNTGSPHYGHLAAGHRTVVDIHGQTIFDGTSDEWEVGYDVNGDAVASMLAIDGLGILARREFDEWTTVAQQPGERLTAILNRPEAGWNITARNLDTGLFPLQSDLVTWGSNVLNYCQLVAESDLGNFYADRNNQITFADRHSSMDEDVAVTFRADGTGVKFHGATLLDGSRVMVNRVGIDREGGVLQTAEDVDSQAEHGIRPLNRSGLLLADDGPSLDMAEYLLDLYMDPAARVSSITVNVSGLDGTGQGLVSGLDLGDLVRIVWTPRSTGTAIDQTLEVLGVEHSIPFDGAHTMTLYTAPAQQTDAFQLDDVTLGVLDTSVLAF